MRMTLVLTAAALFVACVGSSALVPVGLVSSGAATSAYVVPSAAGDQVCGKVHQGNGDATLIADAVKAGTVGCTEAFNVLAEYMKQAPTKAQGTLRQLTINSWDCSSVNGTIGCGNAQGLRFHTVLLK